MKSGSKLLSKPLSHVEHWWRHVENGWRELSHLASRAMTPFSADKKAGQESRAPEVYSVGWSLLPAEVLEGDKDIVVNVEAPGLDKQHIDIELVQQRLHIRGEKSAEKESRDKNVHIIERAYGSFERVVALPMVVDGSKATATYKRGVISVSFPKPAPAVKRKGIAVH